MAAVYRDRRKRASSPYNPAGTVPGSWDDPDTLELPGAWIGYTPTATVPLTDAARSQAITQATVYLPPGLDVRTGDRIRLGGPVPAPGDEVYQVNTLPMRHQNPFTGWQPVTEIKLEEVAG